MSAEEKIKTGEKLAEQGNIDDAVSVFREVIKGDPKNTVAYNNLAVLRHAQGDLSEAIQLLTTAIEYDSSYREAICNLVAILTEVNQEKIAVPLLKNYLMERPEDKELHILLNALEGESGEVEIKKDILPSAAFSSHLSERLEGLQVALQTQMSQQDFSGAETSLKRLAALTRHQNRTVIDALVSIYRKDDRVPEIMTLLKNAAGECFENKKWDEFFEFAYLSIYAEIFFGKSPNYQYSRVDEDLSRYVRLYAKSKKASDKRISNHLKKRSSAKLKSNKKKIGFVLEGFSDRQAPLKTYYSLAKNHPQEQYDIIFYSRQALDSPQALAENYDNSIKNLKSWNCQVRCPNSRLTPSNQIDFLIDAITKDKPDALIFQTTYFVPQYGAVAALRLAPIQAALEHQQAEYCRDIDLLFTPKKLYLDSLSTTYPPLISQKELDAKPINRKELGIPNDATVLISVNRHVRYSQPIFWENLSAVMESNANTWFVGVGLESVDEVIPGESKIKERIRATGFKTNVADYLAMADIYLDLFPSGGGSSVLEAMYFEIPALCFEQDFCAPYSINSETVSSSFVQHPELIIANKDYSDWQKRLLHLIKNPEFRQEKGQQVKATVSEFAPKLVAQRFFSTMSSHLQGT